MSERRRILVVDDEGEIREITTMVLSGAGYDVSSASSGREALRLVQETPYDLVLLDINMPEMDGWETLRILKTDDALRALPVVMFSVKSEFRDKIHGIQEDAVDYITKPFQVDELLSRVLSNLPMKPVDAAPPDDALERYRAEALRLRSVLVDRTTGLVSYAILVDELRGLLENRKHIGVLHVDIGDLDLVESLYGWQVFDRILARVSETLQATIGKELPPMTLLAISAVGGDRFLAFVPATTEGCPVDATHLERMARSVVANLEVVFDGADFAGLSPRLEFRAGHALLSENPFYRFERRVHAAVEEARTLEARREVRREISWEAELRGIIEEAAVTTLFQPVVDLTTGILLGFEALARGPRGSVFERPSAMFAMSKRFGAALELDRLCRKCALREGKALAGKGKLFLNVLPGSLAAVEQEGGILDLLRGADLAPGDLVLEVSERGTDADPDFFAACSEKIRAQGFGLALDDVGTGAATLETLQRMRPDYLKMDVTLVRGIHENLIQQELLSSLVQISRRLGAEVIAEGIELQEERTVLCSVGARYGQGLLFARPLSASQAALGERTVEGRN